MTQAKERDFDSEIYKLKAQVYDLIAESEKAQVFINQCKEQAIKLNDEIAKVQKEKEESLSQQLNAKEE